jgi:hypothetical protein
VACRNCCHIRAKKAAFFTLFYQSKTVSSQFLFLPICRQGRIWSFELVILECIDSDYRRELEAYHRELIDDEIQWRPGKTGKLAYSVSNIADQWLKSLWVRVPAEPFNLMQVL